MSRLPFVALLVLAVGCESAAAVGAPCTRASECAAPLVCELGRCRSECRLNRDCPIEARCLLDGDGNGSCSVATDVCSASTCEGTLLCVDGSCVSGCDPSAAVCPADARCVPIPGTSGGVCDATRNDPDAGVPDAEAGDAGDAEAPDASCGVGSCGEATAIAIGLGDMYTASPCVVRRGGEVWCWGSNVLGDGDPPRPDCLSSAECSPVPVRVLELDAPTGTTRPLTGARAIAAVDGATCVIVDGGGLRCWGRTGNDQIPVALIDQYVAQRGIDAMSRPLAGITALSLGRYTGFALVGSTWITWGQGRYGALATPALAGHAPMPEPALDGLSAVSGGNDFACGVRAAGTVVCWGINAHGELGRTPVGIDPATSEFYFDTALQDIALPTSATAVSIASGLDTACALDSDGHAWCWGSDGHGALGNFAPSTAPCNCDVTPVQVDLPAGVTLQAIVSAPMAALTCGVTRGDALVYCWGASEGGEAGTAMDVMAPEVPIQRQGGGALRAAAVAVGAGGGCAIDLGGDVWCWGRNENGRLGLGTTDGEAHPTASRVVFP